MQAFSLTAVSMSGLSGVCKPLTTHSGVRKVSDYSGGRTASGHFRLCPCFSVPCLINGSYEANELSGIRRESVPEKTDPLGMIRVGKMV